MMQRQRPTKEQEQQMRQQFDRQGAEEQNRGREMMQFNNGQGNPPGRIEGGPQNIPPGGGPGAVVLSNLELLLRFFRF